MEIAQEILLILAEMCETYLLNSNEVNKNDNSSK